MPTASTNAVVVDLDNTLYDWVEFYVPALQEMVAAVAGAVRVEQDEILEQLRDVYGKHGSLEYAFAVQALPAARRLSSDEMAEVVTVARSAFADARERHLHPYPGVVETLEIIRSSDVAIVAASNAPLFQAQRRLRHLGVIEYFDGIAARSSFSVPTQDPAIRDVAKKEQQRAYECPIPLQWPMSVDDLKPSTVMYSRILDDLGLEPPSAIFVGDSLAKDVVPALSLGARGLWARYGTQPRRELLTILLRITPWSQSAISQQYTEGNDVAPAIDSFDALLEWL